MMYSKECPVCGEKLHDDDPDRLIMHMKAHIKGHEEQYGKEDEKRMKSTAASTEVIIPERMNEDETSVISSNGFMSPAVSMDEAIAAFKMFDEAKAKLLRDQDVVWFGGGGKPVAKNTPDAKPYLLKSAWRRMARFFGLSIEMEGREKIENSAGYIWTYRYRITHPCGAFVVSEGVCTSADSFFTKSGKKKADEADVMLKAQTVAINRGVSDLLGSGEVSGEEMWKLPGGE